MEEKFLASTKMLDYQSQSIRQLIEGRGWKSKGTAKCSAKINGKTVKLTVTVTD